METIILAVSLILATLLPGVLGVQLWRRKVKPNPWYGFRTPLTLSNEEVWYEANTRLGRGLTMGGLLGFVATLALLATTDPSRPTLAVLLPVVLLLAGVAQGVWSTSAWLGARTEEVAKSEDGEAEPVSEATSDRERKAMQPDPRVPERH